MMMRARPRITSLKLDKKTIAERVIVFYTNDNQDSKDDTDSRLQRYAKYRMWTGGKDWPWEDATDAAIPDMMTASMRLQDTLHNAVMSQRPPVQARATKKHDQEKESTVDHLIDYQVFVEQQGESIVGMLANDFVNEGFFTAYVPWVKEMRHVIDSYTLGPIPQEGSPLDMFRIYLEGKFPGAELVPTAEGWDWTVTPDTELAKSKRQRKSHKASFFTDDEGTVEVEIEMEAVRYDGPKVIVKDVQDVCHPARCENLQIPGPSNPMGAAHVIMRDYPTVDEIQRLRKSGFYDLLDEEDSKALGLAHLDRSNQEREEQKDIMQGHQDMRGPSLEAKSHKTLTRLMCFDCYDVDGDGLDEDVIFWVILETKTLLKMTYLTQMFPASRPTRPFAEAHLFPVPGRRRSIGMLEMMEGLHDLQKQFFDTMGDAGTISTVPFFFYRASSNMRPEVIKLWPGEGYPLNDPQKDVNFPQVGNQSQAFGFNMLALLNQMEERLTTIGELQLGRVPHGKSSALRTAAGMQSVLSQGDARPERVLRRFFIGLTQIWRLCHQLNQAFLPKKKQFLICGYKDSAKDPYAMVDDRSKIHGDFMFDFSANALNTSKDALQMAYQDMLGVYGTELAISLGITKPDGFYRLLRDWGRSKGPDPDKYISPPTPNAWQPPIFFEEALAMMMDGELPQGTPAEGATQHLQLLQEFVQSDHFGLMEPHFVETLFKPYLERIAQQAIMEQQQQAMLAAAKQFSQATSQPQLPGPTAGPQGGGGQAPMQNNELADETLPTAGGGANQQVAA
jgi:hypothetical protein